MIQILAWGDGAWHVNMRTRVQSPEAMFKESQIDTVTETFNPRTWEKESGRYLFLRPAWSVWHVACLLELHGEFLCFIYFPVLQ